LLEFVFYELKTYKVKRMSKERKKKKKGWGMVKGKWSGG
jgi:hypothetical protein